MQDPSKLHVWHRARALTVLVRDASRRIRGHDAPGLRAQLMDSVQSIGTNIAEGAARATRPDFAKFLDTAAASSMEVEHHLIVAHDLGLISDATLGRLSDATSEVRRMLFGLRKTVLRREAEELQRIQTARALSRRKASRPTVTDD